MGLSHEKDNNNGLAYLLIPDAFQRPAEKYKLLSLAVQEDNGGPTLMQHVTDTWTIGDIAGLTCAKISYAADLLSDFGITDPAVEELMRATVKQAPVTQERRCNYLVFNFRLSQTLRRDSQAVHG